jgi:hypothetical protein
MKKIKPKYQCGDLKDAWICPICGEIGDLDQVLGQIAEFNCVFCDAFWGETEDTWFTNDMSGPLREED